MKLSYISKIQSNLKGSKLIQTKRLSSSILDGSYHSIYKGRSMNFDELREYVAGDEVKDIDWKASARSQKMLVRQYISEKKHNIMLIMDTNKRMLADTSAEQEKREVALMSAGTLAYMVNKNGDYISATFLKGDMIKHFPFKTGLFNIENILANYHKEVTINNESDINKSLDYVFNNYKRRMIIFIVTDLAGMQSIQEQTIKKLKLRHDVLLINISDTILNGSNVYDIVNEQYMSEYFTKDKKLEKLIAEQRANLYNQCTNKFKQLGVAMITVHSSKEIDERMLELLDKHKGETR